MCLRRNVKHDTSFSSVDDTRGGGVGSFGDVFGVDMSPRFEESSTGWKSTHFFGSVSVVDMFREFEEGTKDIEPTPVFGIVSVVIVSA